MSLCWRQKGGFYAYRRGFLCIIVFRRVSGETEKYPSCPRKTAYPGSSSGSGLPAVAIVGARMCTPYGKNQAYRFAAELARQGVQIISGLAQGIDSMAHEGALSVVGGKTFGVLGCGLDVVYPRQNAGLYKRVAQNGGLISEFPEGMPPKAANFPQRNRLISGLADIVLVIEAREKSGSLITVDFALEQGRSVYALPGRVDDALSQGCNRLIAQGAGIACSPDMLLEELKIERNRTACVEERNNFGLASDLELVYSCLDFEPKSVQAIQETCGMPTLQLLQVLVELEIKGMAREIMKSYYVRQS